jgi:plastocyanin
MSRMTTVVLATVVALALAACTQQEPEISVQEQVPADARVEEAAEGEDGEDGEDAPAEAEGEPSVWVAVDVDFTEFDTELPADTPIALTLDNQGNLPHDIVIEEEGPSSVVAADGGQTDTATITLSAGEYTFFCSIPGHRGTMEETVTVG